MNIPAIIGGSGLADLEDFHVREQRVVSTPWGEPSAPVCYGEFAGREVLFLARHGRPHAIPPHRVNYRANLWALKECGGRCVIAINAVGGIRAGLLSGRLVIPEQIIDYTWARDHTFFEDDLEQVTHVDFTRPYSEALRQKLVKGTTELGLDAHTGGTYGATQGPRLETAAEIRRMERDGCDIVGMTGMPEAVLARELQIDYASICVVANLAAGKGTGEITMAEIERHLESGMTHVHTLLRKIIPEL